MQAISRLKIASTFPIHEESSFAQISTVCGLNEPDVRRILRHAMTKHIFKEPRKGIVAHTAASRLLAEDPQILDWVATSTNELWQAASQTVNAMIKYPGSQEPNQTVWILFLFFCDAGPWSKLDAKIGIFHYERHREKYLWRAFAVSWTRQTFRKRHGFLYKRNWLRPQAYSWKLFLGDHWHWNSCGRKSQRY